MTTPNQNGEGTGSTHVLIWPEGRPDDAVAPTTWWGVIRERVRLDVRNLVAISKARRTRVATCREGLPDAHVVEAALEDVGAIPPPGGWPRPKHSGSDDPDALRGDVSVHTHSVI